MPTKLYSEQGGRGRPVAVRPSRERRRGMTSRSDLGKLGERLGLTDLSKGLDACIQILCFGKETFFASGMRRWVTAFLTHVSNESDDIASRMRYSKKFFSLCRENALRVGLERWDTFPPVPRDPNHTAFHRRRFLHQISRVSRSLRLPTEVVVQESLEEHWNLCSDPFETPEWILQDFRQFVRSRFGGQTFGVLSGVSSSASFSRTKAHGGAADEVTDITNNYRDKKVSFLELQEAVANLPSFLVDEVSKAWNPESCRVRFFDGDTRVSGAFVKRLPLGDFLFPYDKKSELSLEDWEAKREILFSLAACWSLLDFDALPSCRQVPVRERGFKVRVATPLEAPFRYVLSFINSALLTKLEAVPEVVASLKGRPAEHLDWTRGVRSNCVFSADLKSATDHFPQDLMEVAIDELSSSWPEELRLVAKRAVGPHNLFNKEGACLVTKRGILMGSPVSWPLLAMYSTWLHAKSGSKGWYAVCGDDYIGCHTRESMREYLRFRELTGAKGSPGKDILAFQGAGVFAEDLVTVQRGRWVPTVSVRGVLVDSTASGPSWSQGPEVAEMLRPLDLSLADCERVCSGLHKDQRLQLRRVGIDPCAPRWIGGGGFPGTPDHNSLVRARRMMSQASEQVITWVTKYEAAWTTSGSSSLLVEAVAEDINRYADIRWDTGRIGEWGPLRDVVASRISTLSWPFLLAGAVKSQWRVGIRSVGSKLAEINDAIASRGYWLPSFSPVDNPEGLVAALQALEPKAQPIPFTPITLRLTFPGLGLHPPLLVKRRKGPGSPTWGDRKRSRLT